MDVCASEKRVDSSPTATPLALADLIFRWMLLSLTACMYEIHNKGFTGDVVKWLEYLLGPF